MNIPLKQIIKILILSLVVNNIVYSQENVLQINVNNEVTELKIPSDFPLSKIVNSGFEEINKNENKSLFLFLNSQLQQIEFFSTDNNSSFIFKMITGYPNASNEEMCNEFVKNKDLFENSFKQVFNKGGFILDKLYPFRLYENKGIKYQRMEYDYHDNFSKYKEINYIFYENGIKYSLKFKCLFDNYITWEPKFNSIINNLCLNCIKNEERTTKNETKENSIIFYDEELDKEIHNNSIFSTSFIKKMIFNLMYFIVYWIEYIPFLIAKSMQFFNIQNEFSLSNISNMEIFESIHPRGLTYDLSLFDNFKFVEYEYSEGKYNAIMIDNNHNPIAVFSSNMTYTVLDNSQNYEIAKYFNQNKSKLLLDIKKTYELHGGVLLLIRNTIWDLLLSIFGFPLIIYIVYFSFRKFNRIKLFFKRSINLINITKLLEYKIKLYNFVQLLLLKIQSFKYNENIDKKIQISLILWIFTNVYYLIDSDGNKKQNNAFWFFNGDRALKYDLREFFILVGLPCLIYFLYKKYYKNKN